MHVGEHHGRDIQVRIEGGTVRIERMFAVPELHGEAVRGRVLVRRGFFSDGVLFSVHGYNSIIQPDQNAIQKEQKTFHHRGFPGDSSA